MQNQTNFHWNSDTIEYFKELYALNENEYYRKIEEFVKYECDLEDGETTQDLFNDLIMKVEYKANKNEYEWIEAKLIEKELD